MTAANAFQSLQPGHLVDHDVLVSVMLPQVGRNTDDRISVSLNGVTPMGVVKPAGGDLSMRAAEYRATMAGAMQLRVEWPSGDLDDPVIRCVELFRHDANTWVVEVAD